MVIVVGNPVQILHEADYISLCANAHEKCRTKSIHIPEKY